MVDDTKTAIQVKVVVRVVHWGSDARSGINYEIGGRVFEGTSKMISFPKQALIIPKMIQMRH